MKGKSWECDHACSGIHNDHKIHHSVKHLEYECTASSKSSGMCISILALLYYVRNIPFPRFGPIYSFILTFYSVFINVQSVWSNFHVKRKKQLFQVPNLDYPVISNEQDKPYSVFLPIPLSHFVVLIPSYKLYSRK